MDVDFANKDKNKFVRFSSVSDQLLNRPKPGRDLKKIVIVLAIRKTFSFFLYLYFFKKKIRTDLSLFLDNNYKITKLKLVRIEKKNKKKIKFRSSNHVRYIWVAGCSEYLERSPSHLHFLR
jgi:hypothetical protein